MHASGTVARSVYFPGKACFVSQAGRSPYRGRMWILGEIIRALLQAVTEAACEALFSGRDKKKQEDDSGD
ncbi:hypothetical protein ACVWYS_001552 [Arthrobacter sp. TE12231]